MKKKHPFTSAVYLLLEKEGYLLLSRRCNTGFQDGNYSLVVGHIEPDEPATLALLREVKEEIALELDPEHLELVHVMHRKGEHSERIDFFMRARAWQGEVQNMEPHKCDDLGWHPWDQLPENMVNYVQVALERIQQGVVYSEFGWEE